MTITFINTYQALIWLLAALLALSLYFWKVRPYLAQRPEFHKFYELADTRWRRIFAWLRIRWDLSAGAVIMALPSIWNGILDFIVFVSLTLADLLPALAGVDLSDWLLPNWLVTSIRVGGAVIPVIRARWVKTEDGDQ